ncbi:unnamed protein product [Lampetra fluviatilis]
MVLAGGVADKMAAPCSGTASAKMVGAESRGGKRDVGQITPIVRSPARDMCARSHLRQRDGELSHRPLEQLQLDCHDAPGISWRRRGSPSHRLLRPQPGHLSGACLRDPRPRGLCQASRSFVLLHRRGAAASVWASRCPVLLVRGAAVCGAAVRAWQ